MKRHTGPLTPEGREQSRRKRAATAAANKAVHVPGAHTVRPGGPGYSVQALASACGLTLINGKVQT